VPRQKGYLAAGDTELWPTAAVRRRWGVSADNVFERAPKVEVAPLSGLDLKQKKQFGWIAVEPLFQTRQNLG
jgi:hypothetical protein